MYRFLLSWRWLGIAVLGLVLVVAFVLLGRWQLGRFEGSQSHDGPVSLATLAPAGSPFPESAADRIVEISGEYDAGGQRLVTGRQLGGVPGYQVVTPLADGQGAVVLVDRGWVASPREAAVAVPSGQRSVVGTLQPPETAADSAVGADTLPAGQDAYVGASPLAGVPEFSRFPGWVALRAEDPAPAVAPLPLATTGIGTSQGGRALNLGYAAQWWLFAAAVVFFGIRMAQVEARERRRGGDAAADPAAAPATARADPDAARADPDDDPVPADPVPADPVRADDPTTARL